MTSLELAVDFYKLSTEFLDGSVRQTTLPSFASQDKPQARVVKTWFRDSKIGDGSFGKVYLEQAETGEYRAVKEIAKRSEINPRKELLAMVTLAKHDSLFVRFLGWYENSDYVHIAMEYLGHGDLRHYLKEERPESEAKGITRQLLGGLSVIHQEGFAHRDLKPENILVASESPIWVKIADFGLAKLARAGTALRTEGGTPGYIAPEAGIDTSLETSEYTNSVDIWALGCIAHEMLTQARPFRTSGEIRSYCSHRKVPKDAMLSKNISESGIEFVERTLAYPPERRVAAKEALGLEWLQLKGEGVAAPGSLGGSTGPPFLGVGLHTHPQPSPIIYSPPNPTKEPPHTTQTTPWRPSGILTISIQVVSAIGLNAIAFLRGTWAFCVALTVNFPVVPIAGVWGLIFWGLVSPLLQAIGIEGSVIRLVLFAFTTYWVVKGIYILIIFSYHLS